MENRKAGRKREVFVGVTDSAAAKRSRIDITAFYGNNISTHYPVAPRLGYAPSPSFQLAGKVKARGG